jgi:hypothetical protein
VRRSVVDPVSQCFVPPTGYARIRVVGSFDELLARPFADGVNAYVWRRELVGDFAAVAAALERDGSGPVDEERLRRLPATAAMRSAIGAMASDLERLRERGHEPLLDCLRDYPRDGDAVLPTDVYSFHVDRADVPTDTFLCTYAGAPSEGLRNDQAMRHVDVPATRARLLARFGGDDGYAFAAFLREHHYDLHYAPLAGAQSFAFGAGNLWRLAVEHPTSLVPACIHRAPPGPAREPRLLLIS